MEDVDEVKNRSEYPSTNFVWNTYKIYRVRVPTFRYQNMSNKKLSIQILGPTDPRTGYLSNSSYHGFTLDGKWWPTVEHYMAAQRFSGTSYEDQIRNAKTVYQVRKMIREKYSTIDDEGRIARVPVYGKDHCFYIRPDWNQVESQLLREAITAKFTQSPSLMKRLLETRGMSIENAEDSRIGPILEQIRDQTTPTLSTHNQQVSDTTDVITGDLTNTETEIVRGMIAMTRKISDMEGQTNIYPEMVEDVVHNLISSDHKDSLQDLVLKSITWFDQVMWSDIYSKMPEFEKLTRNIHSIFVSIDKQQANQIKPSAMIASVIRWYRLYATKSERMEILTRIRSKTPPVLPKISRWYRKTQPPSISKTVRKEPKSEAPRLTRKVIASVMDRYQTWLEDQCTIILDTTDRVRELCEEVQVSKSIIEFVVSRMYDLRIPRNDRVKSEVEDTIRRLAPTLPSNAHRILVKTVSSMADEMMASVSDYTTLVRRISEFEEPKTDPRDRIATVLNHIKQSIQRYVHDTEYSSEYLRWSIKTLVPPNLRNTVLDRIAETPIPTPVPSSSSVSQLISDEGTGEFVLRAIEYLSSESAKNSSLRSRLSMFRPVQERVILGRPPAVTWIGVVACLTSDTNHVYTVLPYSNPRVKNSGCCLGNILVAKPKGRTGILVAGPRHPYVVSMMVDFESELSNKVGNTVSDRRRFFTSCFSQLSKYDIDEIVFDRKSIEPYMDLLRELTRDQHIRVYIDTLDFLEPSEITDSTIFVPPLYTKSQLDDDITRSVSYINLLTPHHLSTEQYSKITAILEQMDSKDRRLWLNNFSCMRLDGQWKQIRKLLS